MIKRPNDWKIISVGGSIIIPPTGFDVVFLQQFRDLILAEVKKGKRFILVVGGGATCRTYNKTAAQLASVTNEDLDWLGIKTTWLNAELVKLMFKGFAHSEVVTNPTKKIKTNKKIIIAAGWKPGCSTDKDAVLLAKTFGAKEVVNLSNIDYIYDSDPKVNPNAKKLETVTWKDLKKIVGTKWTPGANVPFDPMAVKEAAKLGLTVKFARGTNIDAVTQALQNNKITGTIIS